MGDALGEMLSYQAHAAPHRLAEDNLPAGPWFHTDDTEMAISICAVLKSHGHVQQDALAKRFARRFERDPGCHFAGENQPLVCGSKSPTPRCLSSYHFWFFDQEVSTAS